MTVKTAIKVDGYGDFDIATTRAIMVSEKKWNHKILYNEFCALQGINAGEGIDYQLLDFVTNEFIEFLKQKGFVELNTRTVLFSD